MSNKGDTKVLKGPSTCICDFDSQAVAVNDSFADAEDNSEATTINDSDARAFGDCTTTEQNGEVVTCGTP